MTRAPSRLAPLLFLNVFLIATCGLVYELLAGTLASYVLGDSVTQFSLVIGLYLSAMGVGAWLSRFLDSQLALRFLDVELAVALVGGLSAPALFIAFGRLDSFEVVLYGVVVAIGVLVGLELPLLMRLLVDEIEFKDLVSRVLTFDYIGALVASLLFPLLFVPRLGLVRTSLVMGMVNAGVALAGSFLLAPWLGRRGPGVRIRAGLVLALLLVALVKADRLSRLAEEELYADEIVYTETTPYQRIVVTGGHKGGFQLFLNGNLQFSSADEYRYHEALVHPAMMAAGGAPRRVLILGGGDGLALREVLAYPSVERVTLVDLDPAMTRLASDLPSLRSLNRGSMRDPRVRVVNQDALVWLGDAVGEWDVVVIDFPDPNTFALGKLYTTRFYRLVRRALAPGGAVVVQATSPLFARRSFWCIVATLRAAGLHVVPYHTTVPSFGVWGYALARATPFDPPAHAPKGLRLRYLDDSALAVLFDFPADMAPVDVEINQLDNQMLVRYYEGEWRRWEE
ncbi:MAG TPA: polyamine aminopropyltransferase [Kofleriaceae bacterium]|nr:polyamine aminopropyltransferase [Kofleriaceae bacterium]